MSLLGQTGEDLLRILNADQPQEQIAAYLVTIAQRHLDAAAAAYFRWESDLERYELQAEAGQIRDAEGAPFHWDAALVADLLDGEQYVVTVWDLTASTRKASSGARLEHSRLHAWIHSLADRYATLMIIPLRLEQHTGDVLVLLYQRRIDEGDQLLVSADLFAKQAALIIENALLRRQAEQAAVLQERSRLARDLHDSVTQSLYSLTLLAEATRRLSDGGDIEQVRRVASRLGEIGQQALKEMRLLVYQLRPSVLRRVGLVRALGQRLETVERRAGVEARLVVEGDPDLPPMVEEQLYYLAQEALNNALKHAAAANVQVRIAAAGDGIRLEIADDGRGFGVDGVVSEGGFGLSSMRERAEKLGGNLMIDSVIGEGTTVTVVLNNQALASSGGSRRG